MGAAGLVEAGTGRLIFAPNLAWRNALLTDHLWEAIGLPAFADNDNNVAAWGEYRHGAARGYRHVLFVGVGTGIGGGIIVDGKLLRGAHGFAAEIGHIIVEPGGPLCGCGNHAGGQFAVGDIEQQEGLHGVHFGLAGAFEIVLDDVEQAAVQPLDQCQGLEIPRLDRIADGFCRLWAYGAHNITTHVFHLTLVCKRRSLCRFGPLMTTR